MGEQSINQLSVFISLKFHNLIVPILHTFATSESYWLNFPTMQYATLTVQIPNTKLLMLIP